MSAQVLRSDRRTLSASYLLVIITNAARQCLALAEASRSSLLSKSVRSSASSRSRSICGTSFTNAGLRVTESITAHKSRPGNFSIVYRIVKLNLRNRMLASSRRGLLHSQERTWQRRLLVRRIALKRLFCDPSNSVEYDAGTNPYCSRRSDHGVDPSARELAEIADLQPVVANECPKNIRIPG